MSLFNGVYLFYMIFEYREFISSFINEMPDINLTGKRVTVGDQDIKGMDVSLLTKNIVMFRQGENIKHSFIPYGFTLLYLMDSEQSAKDLIDQKIPLLRVPVGIFKSGSSPITAVWNKNYNKDGKEHILALIEGNVTDEMIYIDMISVRPKYRRNNIATKMIQFLKREYPNAAIKTSDTTNDGSKLMNSPIVKNI
jgi:hypothetical protein